MKQKKPTTYACAFVFGSVFGLSWTPCIGSILVAILLLASTSGSALTGGLLLFSYAVGLTMPLLLFATYVSKLDRDGKIWTFIKGKEFQFSMGNKVVSIHATSLISGILCIILGYLIFSGTLTAFNQYVRISSVQKGIFAIEDKIVATITI